MYEIYIIYIDPSIRKSQHQSEIRQQNLPPGDGRVPGRLQSQGRKKRKGSGQYTNTDPLIKFLRQHVSRLNYGVKVPDLGVRPELTIDRLIARYNDRRFGAALKNDQFLDHFSGERTYYFWADHKATTPEILVMIDGDCGDAHGGGTTEGVLEIHGTGQGTPLPWPLP